MMMVVEDASIFIVRCLPMSPFRFENISEREKWAMVEQETGKERGRFTLELINLITFY